MNDGPTCLVEVCCKTIRYMGFVFRNFENHLFDFLWSDGSHEGNILIITDKGWDVLQNFMDNKVSVLLGL
jgi:hypothetical protein